MSTKTLTGSYPAGYALNSKYRTLDIDASAYVGGSGVTAGAVATIANLGDVDGTAAGVTLSDGGALVNGSATSSDASVAGASAVIANGGRLALTNHATLTSTPVVTGHTQVLEVYSTTTVGEGVIANDGGAVTNLGVIAGGVDIAGGRGAVTNSGAIGSASYYSSKSDSNDYALQYQSSEQASVQLTAGGEVDNSGASATISAGVEISGGAGSVANNGAIAGAVSETYDHGLYGAYELKTVEHRQVAAAVSLAAGGSVSNGVADTAAALGGVVISGGRGAVVNDATITGAVTSGYDRVAGGEPSYTGYSTTTYAVQLEDGGTLANGGPTNTSADIASGVGMAGAGGTVTNFATIGADTAGVAVSFGAHNEVLVEQASGVITGKVTANASDTLELGALAGAGTITGLGSTITGFGIIDVEAGAGWHFDGANAIGGLLTTQSGIEVDGTLTVDREIRAGAIVELASGARLDTAAHGEILLEADVSITPAAGATGTAIINDFVLEKRAGSGVSAVRAPLTNDGFVIASSGTLDVTGAITGDGSMMIQNGATLELGGAAPVTQVVTFRTTASVLELNDAEAFSATVRGFGAGSVIDLRGGGFSSATIAYSGSTKEGTLTLTNGAHIARIALIGQYAAANFAASSDGHGGTDITYVATPAPALATPTGH
jgi:hypothetical protein